MVKRGRFVQRAPSSSRGARSITTTSRWLLVTIRISRPLTLQSAQRRSEGSLESKTLPSRVKAPVSTSKSQLKSVRRMADKDQLSRWSNSLRFAPDLPFDPSSHAYCPPCLPFSGKLTWLDAWSDPVSPTRQLLPSHMITRT